MQVGFGNLDVIPKHMIEADFERSDVGALALTLFHGRNDLFAVRAQLAELVKLGVKARADDARIGGEGGRLVRKRAIKAVANVGELVNIVMQAAEQLAST